MVAATASEALANADSWSTCSPGMCLYTVQEWLESAHMYPDAATQWKEAKYRHTDDNPPAGAPVFWTGGSHGYGHIALARGDDTIRTTDAPSSGRVANEALSWPRTEWGLTYAGWTEDIGGTRLPYLSGDQGPSNPNDVEVGDVVLVTAHGGLNGRQDPDPTSKVMTTRPTGSSFLVGELDDGWAGADDDDYWYSSDYLWPALPDQMNPNGVKIGDVAVVTANGGLTARTMPGGPPTLDDDGTTLVRPTGWTFTVVDIVDGWASGGTNWYSAEYLAPVDVPEPTDPTWSSSPTVILDDPTPDESRDVSYLQACVRVAAMTTDDGESYPACYIVAQDHDDKGNLRFGYCAADGTYDGKYMEVTGAGHGQTFHAYRSAAGNLYVWCGEDPAYRHKWQSGTTVKQSSGDKMDYKGSRPVGSYEPWVGFRDATDTHETFYLFDRTDFTGNVNRTKPAHTVTIAKQTKRSQQTWAVSETRIYRLSGATNSDPPHGSMLHVLEVFDWSGKCLATVDVTAMSIETTSDEPEGLTFDGAPGSLLAGKREGSTTPSKRSYPIWTMAGLP